MDGDKQHEQDQTSSVTEGGRISPLLTGVLTWTS